MLVTPVRNLFERRAVEGIEAGDKLAAWSVVVGGGMVENLLDVHLFSLKWLITPQKLYHAARVKTRRWRLDARCAANLTPAHKATSAKLE
jgi:hypothetical protein